MIELSSFIGQLLADIASARTNADYFAASTSEHYHADPFVKTLPIPHYIIDEAEIEVPVMVVGVAKSSEHYALQKTAILEMLTVKLPVLLLRSYKFNYIRERESMQKQTNDKIKSEEKIRAEANKSPEIVRKKRLELSQYEFPETVLDAFTESAKTITAKMVAGTALYMDDYNYEILKILDLSDDFSEKLFREILFDVRTYAEEINPYCYEDSISRSSKYIGNMMFFEFKKILKSNGAVHVDVNTVQMNEYATRDCLMHIKLKIKEQDFNLVVEGGTNGKDKRYLSLT